MVEKKEFYFVKCDCSGCQEIEYFPDSGCWDWDYVMEDYIINEMRKRGWRLGKVKNFCPQCKKAEHRSSMH